MNGLALRFTWGEHRLHSEVLRPGRRAFTVGSAAGVDFPCADVAGAERFTLVPADDTGTVRFPRGMQGAVWRGETQRSLGEAIDSGEAVPDGDGYAVTLGAKDAVRLELPGIAVEALPVPVPKAVETDVLAAIDLRMLNILAAVVVFAGAVIVGAVTRDTEAYSDDDSVTRTQSLAHYLPAPAPAKSQAPSMATHEKKASKDGAAPKQKVADKVPAPKPSDGRDVAQRLGQILSDTFKGDRGGGDPLSSAITGMRKAGIASNGIEGLTLKGDGKGGGGGETIGLGGILRRGRGYGPGGTPEGVGILCKAGTDCKEKPVLDGFDSEPPEVRGMDKDLIRQVIHRHHGEVRYCYELELTKNPNLQGKTAVKFLISGTGAVTASSIVESTVRSTQLENCIAGRVRTWQFPKPPGGGVVSVTYPFVFRSTGK